MQSRSDSLSKIFDISKTLKIPDSFRCSFCFIQVFRTTKCSTLIAPGIPPSWFFGQALTISSFMFSVTKASNSLLLQNDSLKFLSQNFWTKILLIHNFFWHKIYWSTNFLNLNFLDLILLGPTIFWPNSFLKQIFLDPKLFCTQMFEGLIFWT